MVDCIEKFTRGDRKFIYFYMSNFKTNGDISMFVETAKPIMEKYAENSVYTVTNIEGVRFDTETKKIISGWMEFNKPYVIKGALIGIDGIKRIMINSILTMCGRKNFIFAPTRERAVSLLLNQE